jgi:hypothetical protein
MSARNIVSNRSDATKKARRLKAHAILGMTESQIDTYMDTFNLTDFVAIRVLLKDLVKSVKIISERLDEID